MTRTSNYKRAILAYQKTSDYRNGVSKEALVNPQKATKKLANPKSKKREHKLETIEDLERMLMERDERIKRTVEQLPMAEIAVLKDENKRLKEQLKEAQNLIIYTANGHDHLFAEIQCEDYMHKHHLPKWGVK